MIVIHLPSFDTVTAALDWLAEQPGTVERVVLMRGRDGMVRGSAVMRVAT